MAEDRSSERRTTVPKGPGSKICPWCQGKLVLQPAFPLRKMIPGDVRARGEDDIPEALRTIRAWVCATPHCRYRESA